MKAKIARALFLRRWNKAVYQRWLVPVSQETYQSEAIKQAQADILAALERGILESKKGQA